MILIFRYALFCLACFLTICSFPFQASPKADSVATAREITQEATKPNQGDGGHPLPLACHWNTGIYPGPTSKGWAPQQQMHMIEDGHFLLPWFAHPPRDAQPSKDAWDSFEKYYREPIETAKRLHLPITFIATQWESLLSQKPYIDLPAEQNPNVVSVDGRILPEVSPFGPLEPWQEVGHSWTANPFMEKLQEWYPDPPLVIFISNNEHRKLTWPDVEESKRYLTKYGNWRNDNFKRQVVGDGWIERYRALQEGMRGGLKNPQWQEKAMFVAYDAFGPPHFGRWFRWPVHSLHTEERIAPYPLMWDGGSPSYYTFNWNQSTDYTVWSPQVEFMNLVFMQKEAYTLNPNFWFELSVWDGHEPDAANDKLKFYRNKGQSYTPERYKGYVQFGMWLLRPRAVREFRGWTYPWDEGKPYFLALMDAVDAVHKNATLSDWWRYGKLVSNSAHQHPYDSLIPSKYRSADRWFLLDADLNADSYPLKLGKQIRVFSLALVRGQAPERRWLIYAYSPLANRKDVMISIPGYQRITIDASVRGSFYEVNEQTGQTTPIAVH